MVLSKLPVPGCLTYLDNSRARPIGLAEDGGGGCLDIFLLSIISPLSPSLWEMAQYRLKYCLKGQLNPKTTNKP